jgi:capsular polysaccharide biosynthesis protein
MNYFVQPRSFNQTIDYRPPVNMKPEWAHLFKPDLAYRKVKLGARLLSNVFVNHYGLVINNGLLVKGCAPNIGHFPYEDENFYRPHWKKATEQMLVSRFGKSVQAMRLDDNRTYLLIHSPWFSYYFWITECLPRLLMVREHLSGLTLIYPESWKKFSFVNETLALFPQLDRIEIPSDVHLRVKNLVMPEVKPWTPMFIPEYVDEVRNLLLRGMGTPQKRIYISRRKAARKKFTDEKRVADFLSGSGFQEVFMEELNFRDQISLMQETRVLVSMTGAGCINTLFMTPGSGFHDLTNVDYLTKKQYKFHYRKLCDILQIHYAVTFFDHENDPAAFHYSAQNLYFEEEVFSEDFAKLLKHVN